MLICIAYTVEKDTEDRSYWVYDTDDNSIEKCNKEGVCFALDNEVDIRLLGMFAWTRNTDVKVLRDKCLRRLSA